MKSSFFVIAVATLMISLNSCSNDSSSNSSGGANLLSLKADGATYTCNKVSVEEWGGNVYVDGYFSSGEYIYFSIPSAATGNVIDNGVITPAGGNNVFPSSSTSNVTLNNGHAVKGTFKWTFKQSSGGPELVDGTFNLSY